jgi:hypothetical protein
LTLTYRQTRLIGSLRDCQQLQDSRPKPTSRAANKGARPTPFNLTYPTLPP